MIIDAGEQAIGLLPASAWTTAAGQDGTAQKNTAVAEITCLTPAPPGGPKGCGGSSGVPSRPGGR
jgi:hypothetical protein